MPKQKKVSYRSPENQPWLAAINCLKVSPGEWAILRSVGADQQRGSVYIAKLKKGQLGGKNQKDICQFLLVLENGEYWIYARVIDSDVAYDPEIGEIDLIWQRPPARHGTLMQQLVAPLIANPGRWARIGDQKTPEAANVKKSRLAQKASLHWAFLPNIDKYAIKLSDKSPFNQSLFEFTTRGRYIYGKYKGKRIPMRFEDNKYPQLTVWVDEPPKTTRKKD